MIRIKSLPPAMALLLACKAYAASGNPPPPFEPRQETGFSTVEQRYVYGPPDEGEFEFTLQPNALPDEVRFETPETCANPARIKIRYSKSQNKVWVTAKFNGLPFRPSASRPDDVSNQWNQHLTEVHDARYQIWFIGELFTQDVIFFYDSLSFDLLGSEHDFPDGPPPGSFPVVVPGLQMIGSPLFDGKDDGVRVFEWELDYDQMLDRDNNGGTWNVFVPENVCGPDKTLNYYTQGGVGPEHAMTFDDVLASIHSGNGMFMAVTLEPYPKPDFLRSRSNIMTAYQGGYPQEIPEGYRLDFRGLSVELRLRDACGETTTRPKWPGPYYDLCTVD